MAFPKICSVCGKPLGRTLPSHWSRNKERGTLLIWCPRCQRETTEFVPTGIDILKYWLFKVLVVAVIVIALLIAVADLIVISAVILVGMIVFGGLAAFTN